MTLLQAIQKIGSGILNLNKPTGLTSFGVVSLVRRSSGIRQVGHGGTLDPLASGVLPVFLGQATRLMEYFTDTTKTYWAEVLLGASTDTYDSQGKLVKTGDFTKIRKLDVRQVLESFMGDFYQVPPMFSAIKHHGQPLYQLARAGIEVERKPRKVHVGSMILVDWQPPLVTMEIECSKGTYVRSIAHDLGERLGCGAHLNRLVRLRDGIFAIEDAISLEEMTRAFEEGRQYSVIYPMDVILQKWPALVLDPAAEKALREGRGIRAGNQDGSSFGRAYSQDGWLIGVVRWESHPGRWQPRKVFTKPV